MADQINELARDGRASVEISSIESKLPSVTVHDLSDENGSGEKHSRNGSVQFSPTKNHHSAIRPLLDGNKWKSGDRGNHAARNDSVATIASDASGVKHHRGIYWWSPIAMVAFFLIGILAALSHHLYYSSLAGKQVGDDRQQQWSLRWGTTFAYITQKCFVCSAGFAFTQYLWLTLKKINITVKGLDAAFEADQTIVSALNPEVVRKMKVASLIALIIWCLPLPSLVTPATLFVLPNLQTVWQEAPAPSLSMYGDIDQTRRYTYSVQSNLSNENEVFLGPRTIVSRLSTATATLGQILPIQPPFENSSFSTQFFGPAIECEAADSTVAGIIESYRNQSVSSFNGSTVEQGNYYYSFVPDLSEFGNDGAPFFGVKVVPQIRLQTPSNASNQIWMVYSTYIYDSTGDKTIEDQFTVCKLYNASYTVTVSFQAGSPQTVTSQSLKYVNEVDYPTNNVPPTLDVMAQHAYSAVIWAISDLLVGSMGIFYEYSEGNSTPTASFGEITTQIEHTSLLGSSDLDVFFDQNHYLSSNTTTLSDQRIQDIDLADNRTLDVLIPELAFNTTMSFMSSNLLSPSVNTNVTLITSINTYAYHSQNLLLSYGLALLFTLFANFLGAYAYWRNGHSHNKTFSAILASTRDPGLTQLFHKETMGRLPLHKNVQKTRLMFGIMPGSGLGFRKVPERRGSMESWHTTSQE